MKKIIDFCCPMCFVKIPTEYMAKKVELIDFYNTKELVCIGCARLWNATVKRAKEVESAVKTAKVLGMTPEQIIAMRKERQEIADEDEKLVDEEVHVMDTEKMLKLYKTRDNKFGRLKPIQIMQDRFKKGMIKEMEKKIIVPGGFNGN